MFNRLIAIVFLCIASIAYAGDVPQIRMVIPFGTGGLVDTVSRQLQEALEKELNKTIKLDYRPGAGGLIGIKNLVSTRTDEPVIMFVDSIVLGNAMAIDDKINIDDVNYLCQIGTITSIALAVSKNSTLKNINSWKTRKNPISVGINGVGGAHHYYSYVFANQTQAPIADIPFKGVGEMLSMLIGGHIDAMWGSLSNLEQFEQTNKIDIVAISSTKRVETSPDIPTFKELGIEMPPPAKWLIISNVTGDATTIKQIETASLKLINTPSFVQNLKTLGLIVESKSINQSRSTMLNTLQQQAKFVEYLKTSKK